MPEKALHELLVNHHAPQMREEKEQEEKKEHGSGSLMDAMVHRTLTQRSSWLNAAEGK